MPRATAQTTFFDEPDAPRDRSTELLRPEDLRRLKSFEFAPRLVVDGWFAGRHRSRQRGSSTEFADYREYAPGDDPRLVDWRVYARSDRFYIRLFEQETDMDCTVFLDCSGSMGYGERVTKLSYAAFFSAALAYLVVRNGDRIAMHLFDNALRLSLPHGGTRRHLDRVFNELQTVQPGQTTRTAEALHRALPALRHRGLLILLSDFLDDPADIFDALSPYLHRGFRICMFQVLDPVEIELADRGMVTVEDLESGERLRVHTPELRQDYAEAMQAHIRALREMAARRQVRFTVVRTDRSFYELLDTLNQ